MFDLKKTIIIMLGIITMTSIGITAFSVGKLIGKAEGKREVELAEHEHIMRTDSLLRKQTEQCHMLIDRLYIDSIK